MKPARIRHLLLVYAAASMALCLAGCGSTPLRTPTPIHVPSDLAAFDAGAAVQHALLAQHWSIEQRTPGHYIATHKADHMSATVDVEYGDRRIAIHYRSSHNLGYHAGDGTIDKRYNQWVTQLADGIRKFLHRRRLRTPQA